MTMSDRDKKAILLGGLVLGCLIGYRFVMMPVLDSWSDARQRIAQVSAAQSSLDAQVMRLQSQRRQLEVVYGQGIAQPLPPVDVARANFVKTVEDLLKSSGMTSQGVRSQPLRPLREVAGVALVGLQVDCTGQPQQLMRCLANMSAGDQLILVDSVRAAPDSRRPDRMQVSMVVTTLAKMEPAQ